MRPEDEGASRLPADTHLPPARFPEAAPESPDWVPPWPHRPPAYQLPKGGRWAPADGALVGGHDDAALPTNGVGGGVTSAATTRTPPTSPTGWDMQHQDQVHPTLNPARLALATTRARPTGFSEPLTGIPCRPLTPRPSHQEKRSLSQDRELMTEGGMQPKITCSGPDVWEFKATGPSPSDTVLLQPPQQPGS